MSTYLVCFAVSDFIFKEAVHTRADKSTVLVSTVYIQGGPKLKSQFTYVGLNSSVTECSM